MPVLQTRISNEDAAAIKAFAKRKGMTPSALVRESVSQYITGSAKTPSFGCMAGRMWISDDFDDTPEGFEEYM